MTRKILTVTEAAQVIGKSKRTVQLWIQRGELKPISRYIDFDDLIEVDRKMNENRGYRGHKNKGGHADV